MDHAPIATSGQEPDVVPLASHGHGRTTQPPAGSARNHRVVAEAAVASALVGRQVPARLDQTGEVLCLSLAVRQSLPDRCHACGSLEIQYGGGQAAFFTSCRHVADQGAFEVGPCEVLAADQAGDGWNAIVQVPETGDCLGDTCAAGLDPLAPSGAHPGLITDVLLALDWSEIIRRSVNRL